MEAELAAAAAVKQVAEGHYSQSEEQRSTSPFPAVHAGKKSETQPLDHTVRYASPLIELLASM